MGPERNHKQNKGEREGVASRKESHKVYLERRRVNASFFLNMAYSLHPSKRT